MGNKSEGRKHDSGKVRVSLIPPYVVARVFELEFEKCAMRNLGQLLSGGCYEIGLVSVCGFLGKGVPAVGLVKIAEVMEYGALKYGEENWRLVDKRRYTDAAWRHLASYSVDAASVDEESGLLHLAHLGANFAILAGLR